MNHPTTTTRPTIHIASASSQLDREKVHTERNLFGYILSLVSATAWFSLFLYAAGTLFFDHLWDDPSNYDGIMVKLLKMDKLVHPVTRAILALASLLLASFHAYLLHFDGYAKHREGDADDLKTRMIKFWPLVLGTILHVSAVCVILCVISAIEQDDDDVVLTLQHYLAFLVVVNLPLIICAVLLSEDSVSSAFSPWTIKTTAAAESEAESENVPEYRVVGFLASTVLALVWLFISVFMVLILIGPSHQTGAVCSLLVIIQVCSLINFGVHAYILCRPEYDSGDYSTWEEFFKKNWVMVSSCLVMSVYVACILTMKAFYYVENNENESFLKFTLFLIVLSLCSCAILIPSNRSQSCTRILKPWNTPKKAEEYEKEV